jgi:hypothetical protein
MLFTQGKDKMFFRPCVGFLTVMYVTFAVLIVGFCFPHSRVV